MLKQSGMLEGRRVQIDYQHLGELGEAQYQEWIEQESRNRYGNGYSL